MTAVANAGPLINLSWIDRLDLLEALFEEVLVPVAVQEEVLRAAPETLGMSAIRAAFVSGWLKVRPVIDRDTVATLTAFLDPGEAEALVLVGEMGVEVLLLDERRAWAEAQRQGLLVVGTIGILRRAKERGLIPAVYPVVLELQQLGFWVSTALLDRLRDEEQKPGA